MDIDTILILARELNLLEDDNIHTKDAIAKTAKALFAAQNAGLLKGEHAQANFRAIITAAQDSQEVADALANDEGLLTDDSAQANFMAIMTHAQHAWEVSCALSEAQKAGLLMGDSAQANRDLITANALNAGFITSAIEKANTKGLLTGDNAQAIFEAIMVDVSYGYYVVDALSYANEEGLLTGDNAKANISAIAAAGQYSREVAVALSEAQKTGLLTGGSAQANRNAIMATAKNSSLISYALALANGARLISDENKQAMFNTVINCLEGALDDGINKNNLYGILLENPSLINNQTWHDTLKLNQYDAYDVHIGMRTLENYSSESLTPTNYALLLQAGNDAQPVAQLLTGECSEREFTQDNLKKFGLLPKGLWQNNTQFPSTAHYNLYRRFSALPHQFDVDTLAGIAQLSTEQAERLLNLTNRDSIDNLAQRLMSGEPEDVLVHILAEQYLITHLYTLIPQEIRNELPGANDYESSMRDDYINLASERISTLRNEVGFEASMLDEVEVQIRRFLLQAIKSELEQEKIGANNDKKIVLNEKIAFIEEHCEALALRNDAPPELLAKALSYFSSTTSINQTAWRAYEPTAPCIHWPNLLTEPLSNTASDTVFSTRASAQEPLTLTSASMKVRTWSAICFLASKTHPDMQTDFICSLMEIRRAHNERGSETDNPSCYPGTLSRFLTVTNKHPLFAREEAPADLQKVVEQILNHFAQLTINKMSLSKHGLDARLLLSALYLYSPNHQQNKEVLRDKKFIENILNATAEDLNELEAQGDKKPASHLFLVKTQQLRQEFMLDLLGSTGGLIYNAMADKLKALNLPHNPEEINYLIAKKLANLSQIISIPQALLEAAYSKEAANTDESPQMTESEIFEQALFAEFKADMQHAADNGAKLKNAISELSLRLNLHLARLREPNYARDNTHESVVQKKLAQLNETEAFSTAELSVERVCKVLREKNAPQPSALSQQKNMRNALATLRNTEEPSPCEGTRLKSGR